MTTATLNIKPGQKWRTVTGRTVRITAPCDMHGYQFSADYYGTHTGSTYFTDTGISIGRDDLSELIADAPEVKVEAPVVDTYLAAAIDDELTIAALLNWQNIAKPDVITPNCWLRGTHNSRNGHVRNGSVPMPAWRRDWHSAGQLVARCGLHISPSEGGVAVHSDLSPACRAIYDEHPTKDHAIFYSMCKAAIAHLRAEGELKNNREAA